MSKKEVLGRCMWGTCACLVPILFLGGSGHEKLPELAHQKALEKSLGIKGQSCPVPRLSHKAVRLHTSHVVRMG